MELQEKNRLAKIELQKEKAFDKDLRSLITQSADVLKSVNSTKLSLGEEVNELNCLNRYLDIYNKTHPTEHFTYFETLFSDKRIEILNILDDDDWLKSGSIHVRYGTNNIQNSKIAKKLDGIKIMLSEIYSSACDLKDAETNAYSGLDKKFVKGSSDMIKPDIILLHLTRIFYHLSSDEDKLKLYTIVDSYESKLDVKNRTEKPVTRNAQDLPNMVFNLAKQAISSFGLDGGNMNNIKIPSSEEITENISKVAPLPESGKNMLNTMLDSLTKNKELHNNLSNLLSQFNTALASNETQELVSNITKEFPALGGVADVVKNFANANKEPVQEKPDPEPTQLPVIDENETVADDTSFEPVVYVDPMGSDSTMDESLQQ